LRTLEERFPDREVVAISAAKGDGITDLRARLERWLYQPEEALGENAVSSAEVVAAE
jgi:selenocysteine-specific translation elongation factor